MSLDIDINVRAEKAKADVAELTAALKAAQKAAPDGEQTKKLAEELARAKEEAAKLAKEILQVARATRDAAAAAKEHGEKTGKARALFLQAVGGESLPEQFTKITEGFKLAGDGALSWGTRLQGAVGALGIAAVAAGPLIAAVGGIIDHMRESSAAEEAHQRVLTRLGPAYTEASAAARGLATAEELLATRQGALGQHFNLSAEELGRLTVAVRTHAAEIGGNATQAQQQFLEALQRGDAVGLARFGVHLSQADLASRNHAEAVRQMAETYRDAAETSDVYAAAEKQVAKGVNDSAETILQRGRQLREQERGRVANRQNDIETMVRQAEGEREAARQSAAAWEEQSQAASRLISARNTLEHSLHGTASAEETATHVLEKHAEELRHQIELYQEASKPVDENAGVFQRWGNVVTNAIGQAGGLASAQQALIGTQNLLAESANSAAMAQQNLTFQLQAGEDPAQRRERRLKAARVLAQQHAEERRESNDIRRTLTREQRDAHRQGDATYFDAQDIGIGSAGGGGGHDVLREAKTHLADLERQWAALHNATLPYFNSIKHVSSAVLQYVENQRTAIDTTQREHETSRQYFARLNAGYQEAITREQEFQRLREVGIRMEEQRWAEAQRSIEQRMESLRRTQEQLANKDEQAGLAGKENEQARLETEQLGSVSQQFFSTFNDMAEGSLTGAQKFAKGAGAAFQSLAGAVTSHFQALQDGRESGAEALRGIAHDTLQAIGQMALVNALVETAAGIASLAVENYKGAIQHFAAAGVYAGVALLAGLGAAATAAPAAAAGGAGAGAGPQRAASAVPPSNNGGQQGPTQVVYYISGLFGERAEEELARLHDGARNRNLIRP